MKHFPACIMLLAFALASCGGKTEKKDAITVASFSADSAYAYIQQQVDFGARVPGTDAHYQCARYLRHELQRHGWKVSIQQGQMPNFAGEMQPIYNIIGSINLDKNKRILLCAHWDSRPWADEEEDYMQRQLPILGANDGASGVGVLLEIARQLSRMETERGIDIIFFDAEDAGTPAFYTGKQREDTWCLGSQLWASTADKARYQYGILLDMVGAPDAVFPKEYHSMEFASNYVEKVWRMAQNLGYGQYFSDTRVYPITDDHYYINALAGIPCIDIIHYNVQSDTGFPDWWHTQADDMRNISPTTLDAVGKVVLTTILN